MIIPSNNHVAHANDAGRIGWLDPVAFLGVGGVWMCLYFLNLASQPLLPQNATDQPELIPHDAHGTPAHAH